MLKSKQLHLANIYHLVTGSSMEPRLRNVDLLIEENRVVAIDQAAALAPRLAPDRKTIDCSTKLVMPGLVNTHHHMYQTLQRNIPAVQNAKLFDWLKTLYPIWQHLTAEVVRVSTQLACAELLKTGCTTTSDHHYLFPVGVKEDLIGVQVEAARDMGIRFCTTRGSMSRGEKEGGLPPQSVVQSEPLILEDCQRVIEAFHDNSEFSMCRVALAPCSPFSVSPSLMQTSANLARKFGVHLHTHLAETLDEETYCLATYGERPLALMESWGWTGRDVWFAHGIHFNDRELETLCRTQTGIAHCPSSNMRLGSGICRVPELIKQGASIGLGVDGSASNDSSDMMGELRSCLLLHRVLSGASAITVDDVFKLATVGGAAVLGWNRIGRLAPGYAADLVLVEMNRLDYAGALSDPLAALMFCGASHFVDTSIVNGTIVVENGNLLTANEHELTRQANRLSKELLDSAGHDTRWML